MAVFLISDSIIISSFYDLSENLAFAVFLNVIIFASVLYVISEINFTGISMIAAISGYAAILPGILKGEFKENKNTFILFFIMELLSVCIRRDSMLLIQPLGIIVTATLLLSVKLCDEDKEAFSFKTESVSYIITVLVILISVMLLFLTGNILSGKYSGRYRNYYHFNNMITAMTDYYDKPVSYDDISVFTEGTNITESRWRAMSEYTTFDWDADQKVYDNITGYIYGIMEHPDAGGIIKGIFANTYLLHSFWMVLLLEAAVVFLSHFKGMRRFLIPIYSVVFAHFCLWGYLVYMGRILQRIRYPLFLCEGVAVILILLAAIRIKGGLRGFLNTVGKKIAFIAVMTACIAGAGMISQGQYEECLKANTAKKSLVKAMEETVVYCSEHPDNQYILDENAFGHYFAGPFDTGYNSPANYTLSGGWFSMMPDHADRMKEIIYGRDEFYYIVVDYSNPDYMRINGSSAKHFEEITGRKPVLCDTYYVSSGQTFLVYKF